MKIKFGAIVTDGRGKIGGHVASKNRSGAYLRTKVTPTNPNTTLQSAIRASFGALAQGWAGLSQEQRSAWNNAVSEWSKTDIFGDIKNPTGQTLFIRLNQVLSNANYAQTLDVPSKLPMVEGVISSASLNITTGELDFVGRYTGADAKIVVYATGTVGAGVSFIKNKLRQIYAITCNNYDGADADSALILRFGDAVVGDVNWFGVRYVLPNGQQSPMQIVRAVATV